MTWRVNNLKERDFQLAERAVADATAAKMILSQNQTALSASIFANQVLAGLCGDGQSQRREMALAQASQDFTLFLEKFPKLTAVFAIAAALDVQGMTCQAFGGRS